MEHILSAYNSKRLNQDLIKKVTETYRRTSVRGSGLFKGMGGTY